MKESRFAFCCCSAFAIALAAVASPRMANADPVFCSSSADCAASEFCTTEEGACYPPRGCCDLSCPDVCYGNCVTKVCEVDTDCRAAADYCTGCDCRAFNLQDAAPICTCSGVQCFRNPCDGIEAFCDNGRCALGPGWSRL